jgi:dienelactone hydrolase
VLAIRYQHLIIALLATACGSSNNNVNSMIDARAVDAKTADAQMTSDGQMTADASNTVGPYGADGPHQWTVSNLQVTRGQNSPFAVSVYVPDGTGPFPVVVLSAGAQQPAAAYAPYATRLASWGIASVLRDDPGLFADAAGLVLDVSYTVTDWLAAQNAAAGTLHGKLDTTKIGLAGHSRGGRVSLLSAEADAKGKIRGVFGLDTVDDRAPYCRTTIATVGVPIALLGETTDSGANDCAPNGQNYAMLYEMAASPAVAITLVHADHTMFQDQSQCVFCSFCTKGTADPQATLATSVRYLTAFFARELLGDSSVGAAFDGAGASIDVAAGAIMAVSK